MDGAALLFDDPQQSDQEASKKKPPGEISDLVLNRFVWRDLQDPAHWIVTEQERDVALYDIHLKKLGR